MFRQIDTSVFAYIFPSIKQHGRTKSKRPTCGNQPSSKSLKRSRSEFLPVLYQPSTSSNQRDGAGAARGLCPSPDAVSCEFERRFLQLGSRILDVQNGVMSIIMKKRVRLIVPVVDSPRDHSGTRHRGAQTSNR